MKLETAPNTVSTLIQRRIGVSVTTSYFITVHNVSMYCDLPFAIMKYV